MGFGMNFVKSWCVITTTLHNSRCYQGCSQSSELPTPHCALTGLRLLPGPRRLPSSGFQAVSPSHTSRTIGLAITCCARSRDLGVLTNGASMNRLEGKLRSRTTCPGCLRPLAALCGVPDVRTFSSLFLFPRLGVTPIISAM